MSQHQIWKYPVPVTDEFEVQLPIGAKFLDVQMQYAAPQMWFLVNTEHRKEARQFTCVGTGHVVEGVDKLKFLGTFQPNHGLVFHLFEREG